ncbi:hypothetical protein [Sphingobium sp. Leaf26]|uniref:hypothetical protein n=1 Tax=Sphingobium sp. Leaf26 TaxID=1735693 RepID=UPI0012E0D870|nr:hypothetical protein [Sphingobium sp. Leaf26]
MIVKVRRMRRSSISPILLCVICCLLLGPSLYLAYVGVIWADGLDGHAQWGAIALIIMPVPLVIAGLIAGKAARTQDGAGRLTLLAVLFIAFSLIPWVLVILYGGPMLL